MTLYKLDFRGYTIGGVECILPPLCSIPGSVFAMGIGSLKLTHDDPNGPKHPVEVSSFWIGQHPVTVAEYACAVRAMAVGEPPTAEDSETDWQKQLTRLDHPVVCITWYAALAYIRWIAETTGQPWHLPSEAEWEKAARWDPEQQDQDAPEFSMRR